MFRNRLSGAATLACLIPLTVLSGAGTAAASGSDYQPEMVAALARTLGTSDAAAVQRLDGEAAAQRALTGIVRDGVRVDGAFFDGKGALTVNTDQAGVAKVRAAGLTARTPARGEAALAAIQSKLDALASGQAPSGVAAWGVDVAADVVTIKVADPGKPQAKAFLAEAAAFGSAVRVERVDRQLSAQATIYPGSKMTINATSGWCSVGFGARSSSGTQYLVTAGHCVDGLPELRFDGTRFAKGTSTRYALGRDSVDMGIARVDAGNSIATQVGTWGAAGLVSVKGSTRAAVGSSICKSGATTGWTCGSITGYNQTVTYIDRNGGPDTVIRGLGASTVCTMGGDSGGAYISGSQAQGMTSGGPTDQQCTWNGGNERGKSSYFQPLGDALSYYGLTLNVG
ncbi:S1 family peptidase [Nocardia sp. NRRL S-836]|uniref:S1 family peptidase n=1 Tax=Nocardia sp. NRRL S-836 TaxID=1519492 RepID=UPI000A4BB1A3|nr:S1 family peptidase [Nocardia sp. NRRL S-836]